MSQAQKLYLANINYSALPFEKRAFFGNPHTLGTPLNTYDACIQSVGGVTTPTAYVSEKFTCFPMHTENQNLAAYSLNLGPKFGILLFLQKKMNNVCSMPSK